MKIILCAIDNELEDAWLKHCGNFESWVTFDDVEIFRGGIFESGCDAVVSPANSFGFMDGGIDLFYLDRWPDIQKDLQDLIRKDFGTGEILVGQAQVVSTFDREIPWLVSAPTMRVPMVLPEDTIAPYLAARAALLACERVRDSYTVAQSKIKALVFPGLGTGVGRVPADICARQVAQAIKDVSGMGYPDNFIEAQDRHQALYSDEKPKSMESG